MKPVWGSQVKSTHYCFSEQWSDNFKTPEQTTAQQKIQNFKTNSEPHWMPHSKFKDLSGTVSIWDIPYLTVFDFYLYFEFSYYESYY